MKLSIYSLVTKTIVARAALDAARNLNIQEAIDHGMLIAHAGWANEAVNWCGVYRAVANTVIKVYSQV